MAAALPWVATALAAGGAVMQANAASDARDAARRNAEAKRKETAEQARRLRMQQQETEARTRAAAAASGAGIGSESQQAFKDRMQREHSKELSWLKRSGSRQASLTERQGDVAYAQGMAGAVGSAGSAAGGAYGYFGPSGG